MDNDRLQQTTPDGNPALAWQRLRALGMSAHGVQQLLAGHLLSHPHDRTLIAQIVVQAASGYGMHFWPRVGGEVIVGY